MGIHANFSPHFPILLLLLFAAVATSQQPDGGGLQLPAEELARVIDSNPIVLPFDSPRSSYNAQNRSTPSLCPCSPSARGHPMLTLPIVKEYIALVRDFSSLTETSLRIKILERKLAKMSEELTNKYGWEGYINLDAAFRSPDLRLFCNYDIKTGRNLLPRNGGAELVSVKSCDQFPQIFAAPTDKRRNFVPSPGPLPPLEPGESPEIETLSNVETVPSTWTPTPSQTMNSNVEPSLTPPPSASSSPSAAALNEGCVAIEHLVGHSVQHANHLWRPVLCASAFCATPNHAIIVDGEWTSMRKLCAAEWKCVREMRLVNNMKIAMETRLRVNERIVITPYDARFPVAMSWFVQMMEDVLWLVLLAFKIALSISVVLIVREMASKKTTVAAVAECEVGKRTHVHDFKLSCRSDVRSVFRETAGFVAHQVRC